MSRPEIGSEVRIDNTSHRKHGCTGTVIYHGQFLGSVGVNINGEVYGFMPGESVAL